MALALTFNMQSIISLGNSTLNEVFPLFFIQFFVMIRLDKVTLWRAFLRSVFINFNELKTRSATARWTLPTKEGEKCKGLSQGTVDNCPY